MLVPSSGTMPSLPTLDCRAVGRRVEDAQVKVADGTSLIRRTSSVNRSAGLTTILDVSIHKDSQ
jgi:hypothetical protein